MTTNNEQKRFLSSSISFDFLHKTFDFYDSIEDLYRLWGVPNFPLIEQAIKISHQKISHNRFSIPIFGIQNVHDDCKKIKNLFELLCVPDELYKVICDKHKNDIRMIIGINFDTDNKRIYFQEGNKGFGYEFNSQKKFRIKTYNLVKIENHPSVVKNIKDMISSNETFEAVMDLLPQSYWGQVACRKKYGLTAGYHISDTSKRCIKSIPNQLMKLFNCLLISTTDFKSWFDLNKKKYIHWIGLGFTDKNQTEITIYLRSDNKDWDEYSPPLNLVTYFRQQAMKIG